MPLFVTSERLKQANRKRKYTGINDIGTQTALKIKNVVLLNQPTPRVFIICLHSARCCLSPRRSRVRAASTRSPAFSPGVDRSGAGRCLHAIIRARACSLSSSVLPGVGEDNKGVGFQVLPGWLGLNFLHHYELTTRADHVPSASTMPH